MDTFIYQYAKIAAGEFNIGLCVLAKLAQLSKKFNLQIQPMLRRAYSVYLTNFTKLGKGYHRKLINHPFNYETTHTKIYSILELRHNGIGMLIPAVESKSKIYAVSGISIVTRSKFSYVSCLYIVSMPIHISNASSVTGYLEHSEKKKKKYLIDGVPNEVTDPGEYIQDVNIPLNINPIPLIDCFGTYNQLFLALNYDFDKEIVDGEPIIGISNNAECLIYSISHIIVNYKVVDVDAYNWNDYMPMINTNGDLSTNMHKYSVIRKK